MAYGCVPFFTASSFFRQVACASVSVSVHLYVVSLRCICLCLNAVPVPVWFHRKCTFIANERQLAQLTDDALRFY